MQLSPSFLQHLEANFQQFLSFPVQIDNVSIVQGGDINECLVLTTSAGQFFLKINNASQGQDFFALEAEGLSTLAATQTLKIPQPLFHGKFGQSIFLVMDYLITSQKSVTFWRSLGYGLANLHRNTSEQFGNKHSNFIGRLVQSNRLQDSWEDFFREERILNHVKKAFDSKLLDETDMKNAERMCTGISGIIPAEPPSLLHGDLWSGNIMALQNGNAAVFDPAIYFGHREMDLAMTRLFGGFDDTFYTTYNEEFPVAAGWEDRLPVFQLYPLLIHLLLFGSHYRHRVTSILKKFS